MALTRELRWGRPPVPFLAEHIAEALRTERLPESLRVALQSEGARPSILTRSGFGLAPADDASLERVGTEVVRFAQEHGVAIYGLPLLARPLAPIPRVILETWPTRARNVVIRLAAPNARHSGEKLGDVLRVPQVGMKTLLQVAALLEVWSVQRPTQDGWEVVIEDHHLQLVSVDGRVSAALRWARAPVPLLPEALRRAFADERLPSWLRQDLRLPADATALALDSSVWQSVETVPDRVLRYVYNLVAYRTDEIRDLHAVPRGWGDVPAPSEIAWPTRVRNCLNHANLMTSRALTAVTFGDLLGLPGFGTRSMLEFSAIAELVAVPEVALTEKDRAILLEASGQPWADQIRADDPRFRDVTPPYRGSMRELFDEALDNPQGQRALTIASSVGGIAQRMAEVEAQPLDEALAAIIRLSGISHRDADITIDRFGWGGEPPKTLQQVGDAFGVTRERVRQVVDRALGRIGHAYVPQLDGAMEALRSEAPIDRRRAAELLVERGLASTAFWPEALIAAGEALGQDAPFRLEHLDGTAFVIADDQPTTGAILSKARREAGRVGVSNVEEVMNQLEADGIRVSSDVIRSLLETTSRISFLNEGWFWMPNIPHERNRLRNCTLKMLSVAPRMAVATARQGLRRHYRWRGIDLVPPVSTLEAFYEAHDEFDLHEDSTVSAHVPVDYRSMLGDVERVLVEVLRSSPTGLMDRTEFGSAAIRNGVNANTFSVMTTYSLILDHPATNVWCLRGQVIDPAALAALREAAATRDRVKRTVAYGWQEDGKLAVSVLIADAGTPIKVPSDVARYVAGRRFEAVTIDGSRAGTIVVDDSGTSWGYSPFLSRRGVERGDVLTVSFDLVTGAATLSLGDDSELDAL